MGGPATGPSGEERITNEQRIATTTGRVIADRNGVRFADWTPHRVILEPDGVHYQTMERAYQGEGVYAFRDPWFFKDPKTGKGYLLFEGNSAGAVAERTCKPEQVGRHPVPVPESSVQANGSIGIAAATNSQWQPLPPLLDANCVNEELERPHLLTRGNRYYLFFDTHSNKFAPGLRDRRGCTASSHLRCSAGRWPRRCRFANGVRGSFHFEP